MKRTIDIIAGHSRIDGVIPGVRGQRAFPNKETRTLDPFILLDHIGAQYVGPDFKIDGDNGAHPHRGFETLTFMFEGEMTHMDSIGNKAMLSSGSVQRMNAGSGIIHGGEFLGDRESMMFNEIQLWLNLPSSLKMSTPDIQNVGAGEFPEVIKGNVKMRIVAGDVLGEKGPINPAVSVKIIHAISSGKEKFTVDQLPNDFNLFVYVIKGKFSIDGKGVEEHQTVIFNNDGDNIDIQALGDGELLIAAGKPIGETVVMGVVPFVMNTQQEIDEAYKDYRQGKFGKIK